MKKLQLLAEHIAKGNPEGLVKVAKKNNYHAPKSIQGGIGFIHKFVNEKKDDALKQLALIHPDREIILASVPAAKASSNFGGDEVKFVGEPKGIKAPVIYIMLMLIVAILVISIAKGSI